MSTREWTMLFFRLLAIYLIVNTVVAIPLVVSLSVQYEHWGLVQQVLMVLGPCMPLIVGVMILTNTDRVTDIALESVFALRGLEQKQNREVDDGLSIDGSRDDANDPIASHDVGDPHAVVPDDEEQRWVLDFPRLNRDDIHAILFSLFGAWLITMSLPDAIALFAQLVRPDRYGGNGALSQLFEVFAPTPAVHPLQTLVLLSMGVFLFGWSYWITRMWSGRQRRT